MKFFKQYYCLIPLLLIIVELIVVQSVNFSPTLTPSSVKNSFLENTVNYLHTAKLEPFQLTVTDSPPEIYFYLQNPDQTTSKVIFSQQKDSLKQVTALQKLIKIANIKGSYIKFIDLASKRPYATF